MTVMRRFIIDKMPLIFSTPRYFGHIPLLAVPCRTLQLVSPYDQGRNAKRRWATTLYHAPTELKLTALDVRRHGAG